MLRAAATWDAISRDEASVKSTWRERRSRATVRIGGRGSSVAAASAIVTRRSPALAVAVSASSTSERTAPRPFSTCSMSMREARSSPGSVTYFTARSASVRTDTLASISVRISASSTNAGKRSLAAVSATALASSAHLSSLCFDGASPKMPRVSFSETPRPAVCTLATSSSAVKRMVSMLVSATACPSRRRGAQHRRIMSNTCPRNVARSQQRQDLYSSQQQHCPRDTPVARSTKRAAAGKSTAQAGEIRCQSIAVFAGNARNAVFPAMHVTRGSKP
jgi:hypothetical protein